MTDNDHQPRHIPDSECAQGRCGSLPAGCRGECDLRRAFGLNNVACGDPIGGQVHPASALPSSPARWGEQLDERALFEAWAKQRGHDIVSRLETGGKFYVSSLTRLAWEIWQARAAITQQAAPEAPTVEPAPHWIGGPQASLGGRSAREGYAANPEYAKSYASPVAAPAAPASERPELTVWYGSMPESNGKSNFTAVLMRKDAMWDGPHVTIERSEYPDRIRYEADRVRYLIGELKDEPFILDYDAKKHSGYVEATMASPEDTTTASAVTANIAATLERAGHAPEEAAKLAAEGYANSAEDRATTASAPAPARCKHGVWAADHCYQCAADATTASASADTAEFRRLSYAYAEALFKGTVPETSAAWAALVEHVDSLTPAPSPAAPPALTEEIPAQTGTTERAVLQPMPEQGGAVRQWFFDCDGHYIDVAKDEQGRYSIFFKDRSSGKESWLDQAQPGAGAALTEEAKNAARYLWLRNGSWSNQTHPEIREHMMTRVDRASLDAAIDAAIASHIKAGQAGKEEK